MAVSNWWKNKTVWKIEIWIEPRQRHQKVDSVWSLVLEWQAGSFSFHKIAIFQCKCKNRFEHNLKGKKNKMCYQGLGFHWNFERASISCLFLLDWNGTTSPINGLIFILYAKDMCHRMLKTMHFQSSNRETIWKFSVSL